MPPSHSLTSTCVVCGVVCGVVCVCMVCTQTNACNNFSKLKKPISDKQKNSVNSLKREKPRVNILSLVIKDGKEMVNNWEVW